MNCIILFFASAVCKYSVRDCSGLFVGSVVGVKLGSAIGVGSNVGVFAVADASAVGVWVEVTVAVGLGGSGVGDEVMTGVQALTRIPAINRITMEEWFRFGIDRLPNRFYLAVFYSNGVISGEQNPEIQVQNQEILVGVERLNFIGFSFVTSAYFH